MGTVFCVFFKYKLSEVTNLVAIFKTNFLAEDLAETMNERAKAEGLGMTYFVKEVKVEE